MAVVLGEVLVGQAVMYTAPVGTAAPLDTLATGADWLSPWTHIGATEEGVSLAVGTDTVDIRIEEKLSPVYRLISASNIRVLTGLSQDTLASMKLAYGGGTITTTAGVKETLTLSPILEQIAVGFEAKGANGFARRLIVPKVVSVADITTPYRRTANNRAYGLELYSLSEREEISIVQKLSA